MRIRDLLDKKRPALSFEFFPPKDDIGFWDLHRTIESLKPLDPTYVSVTYGAGGGTRRKTLDLVQRIKTDIGIESMAHLTCVEATVAGLEQHVAQDGYGVAALDHAVNVPERAKERDALDGNFHG